MSGIRTTPAAVALALILAAAAPPANASAGGPGVALVAARARAVTHVQRRLAVLQRHASGERTQVARSVAAHELLVEQLARKLARLQELPCRTEAACERREAKVALLQAHIALGEQRIAQKETALRRRLAHIEREEQRYRTRLAHIEAPPVPRD